jgi:(1->4)-alpha-D-glucan 1-alpha-D-glucosylmutase
VDTSSSLFQYRGGKLSRMLPYCTYRVQLHKDFTFEAAGAQADYLRSLGVSHMYCSPYLQAAPGSTHGYDVVDHSRVNDELGGAGAHAEFCLALGRNNLGQVLDIVPNHMAIGQRANKWWWDVLENGPSSAYASFFDVEWDPPEAKLRDRVLIPVLGDHYGRVLEAGELKLHYDNGDFTVHYYEHVMPVAPESLAIVLRRAAAVSGSDELAFASDHLAELPVPTEKDEDRVARRHRDKEVLRRAVQKLYEQDKTSGDIIDSAIEDINADPDALDEILSHQNYRLAHWRTAGRNLPYRRFFDINTLAGLRMEDRKVFAATHELILRWLRDGVIDGVRVDHPDGLRDPDTYFRRIHTAAPHAWVVAEKILEPGERLREWEVSGTTGYDFTFMANNVLVNRDAEPAFTALYSEFTGESSDCEEVIHDSK